MDSHSQPSCGLVAYFVIIPMFLASVSPEAGLLAPDDWKTTICNGFRRGLRCRPEGSRRCQAIIIGD